MKSKIYVILSAIVAVVTVLSSCSSGETYADQKERERNAISTFLTRNVVIKTADGDTLINVGTIEVIQEDQFESQGQVTYCSENGYPGRNQYVQFSDDGVYMQILRKGDGEKIKQGESCRVAVRFLEYNILGDSIKSTNDATLGYANIPEIMGVTNTSGTLTGTFDISVGSGSIMYYTYGSTDVPDGWLVPLEYVNVGRQNPEGVAKVRLIVPHTAGTTAAISNVYPCFYQLYFTRVL